MPITLPPSSPFATLSAGQVIARQERLLAGYAAQDAADEARRTAQLLATLRSL
jgi:hypothetical protein